MRPVYSARQEISISICLLCVTCLFQQVTQVGGSHFRGGSISWTPIGNKSDPYRVLFTFKYAWRRDYSNSKFQRVSCNDNTINKYLVGQGFWACVRGCSIANESISSALVYCTSYSAIENWSQGERSFNYSFQNNGIFTVRFVDCCWIRNAQDSDFSTPNRDWSIQTTGSFAPRPDNGKINSPPVSASSPIIRLYSGCHYSLNINTADADGDDVRCRWSVGSAECGGVCKGLPGATLEANPCVIHYDAGSPGWYPVALTLEDYAKPPYDQPYVPLSQVPLQFLVNVQNLASKTCEPPLTFVAPTPVGDCIAVPRGNTLRVTVAVAAEKGASLKEVLISAPVGTVKSAIYGTPPTQYVNITWTPTDQQMGLHVLCFRALDNNGVSTEQRCSTIFAHSSHPKILVGTQTPHNTTIASFGSLNKFSVLFDQEIKRPQSSKYITVFCRGEGAARYQQAVSALDTSSSPAVTVHNRTLSFYIHLSLKNRSICHIAMDAGSAVGLQSCGRTGIPSESVSNPLAWTFTFDTVNLEKPCSKNGGRGDCQFRCNVFANNRYNCSCDEGYNLAFNQHSCYKKTNMSHCLGECNGNGVCLGSGYCDCQFGWQGETCFEAVCPSFADCSNHGFCLAPNTCACKLGWSGLACSIDLCTIHSTCAECTNTPGCGWCDASHKCSAGSGYGPDEGPCASWFYYRCTLATSINGSSLSEYSSQIAVIDCTRPCVDNVSPKTQGPGSQPYCNDFYRLCQDYSNCFQANDAGRHSWNENRCPFGIPLPEQQISKRDVSKSSQAADSSPFFCDGPNKIDVNKEKATGKAAVEEVVRRIEESGIFPSTHGLLRRIAWVESMDGKHPNTFRDPSAKAGVGIWQMDKGTFNDLKMQTTLYDLFRKVKKRFGIDFRTIERKELSRPLVSALAARIQLYRFKEKIPLDITQQAKYWKKYYNTKKGSGTVEKFLGDMKTLPKTKTLDEGCQHGFRDPNENCKCFCDHGFEGGKCDQPKCLHCKPSRPPCSGNGMCELSNDGTPRCRCHGRWEGDCCETCPPAFTFGDPHILTIDGFEYDFFGVGSFWSCISRENDFGVELAFFAFKSTSVVGAAALKVGNAVATVVSVANSSGEHVMPALRINQALVAAKYGDEIPLGGGDVTLYVNRGTNGSALVAYFFKYSSGATYNIEVRYSDTMKRQYLDPAIGPPIAFIKKTEGLCGTMDDNATNNFVGPDGTLYSDHIQFAESWRIPRNHRTFWDVGWSWNASNFNRQDNLSSEYFDPGHTPLYDLSSYDSATVKAAQTLCRAQAVPGDSLTECVFDVVVTGDKKFANQPAFEIGKCLHDCSNHGDCMDGSCVCTGLWHGEDCSQGGCQNCAVNSDCVNGFCQCVFGYYPLNGKCIRAQCTRVNNCTSPDHGRCQLDDTCLCNPGYVGADCSRQVTCSDNCHGRGSCTDGDKCICDPNWSGDRCTIPTCTEFQKCLDHGICSSQGTCDCIPGWTGSNCGLPTCFGARNCSSQGKCVAPNTCLCQDGYTGPNCSQQITCPLVANCSGNGICLDKQTCRCLEGFAGRKCDFPVCRQGCSSQGKCVTADFCECKRGWTGKSCSQPSCEEYNYCSGHGECIDYETCDCFGNWTGPSCNVPVCTSVARNILLPCSGKGRCVGPAACACNVGYQGFLCESEVELTKPPTTVQSATAGSVRVKVTKGIPTSTVTVTVVAEIPGSDRVIATLASMSSNAFEAVKSMFREAVADAVTNYCAIMASTCLVQPTRKPVSEFIITAEDVIVLLPVAESGPDVMVTFYLQEDISAKNIIRALDSEYGLQRLNRAGFTLKSVSSGISTPERGDSGLATGALAAIISVVLIVSLAVSGLACYFCCFKDKSGSMKGGGGLGMSNLGAK